jgi:hypothetical protein
MRQLDTDALLRRMDLDGDAIISYSEFVASLAAPLNLPEEEHTKVVYSSPYRYSACESPVKPRSAAPSSPLK